MINHVVYSLALRDLLRSKKALFALLVSLVPAILALLAFIESKSYQDDWYPAMVPGLSFVGLLVSIPLTCLILAGGLIADEAEDRTLSYLLVRPISRQTLYLSRGLAVLVVAVALAILQVITAWLVEVVAYTNLATPGQTINAYGVDGVVDATALLWLSLFFSIIVAAAAAVLYTAMFGAGSVILPRYHFFGNMAFFLIWEVSIGLVPLPTAWLSGSHALRAWLAAMDPTMFPTTYARGWVEWLGIPVSFVLIAVWIYVGVTVMRKRDFHVTSAAT